MPQIAGIHVVVLENPCPYRLNAELLVCLQEQVVAEEGYERVVEPMACDCQGPQLPRLHCHGLNRCLGMLVQRADVGVRDPAREGELRDSDLDCASCL